MAVLAKSIGKRLMDNRVKATATVFSGDNFDPQNYKERPIKNNVLCSFFFALQTY